MSHPVRIRRALLSVHDKHGLVDLGRGLATRGVELISTGGTARALTDAGIAVTTVEQVTDFPEMLDGRVKTLHPAIHGGLLYRRGVESHERAVVEHGIRAIDLVCVSLYPFERTTAKPGVADAEAIEQIDIGGPSMIRSAAKNFESVAVLVDPSQYGMLESEMREHDGCTTLEFRRRAACTAFARTAGYDAAIAAWMGSRGASDRFPPLLARGLERHSILRYGENPHQAGAAYRDPSSIETSVLRAEIDAGKELSYNNILDASAALEAAIDLHSLEPSRAACCIVKHTNPCGAAIAATARDAFLRAWEGDPLAAYGGIVAASVEIDRVAADAIAEGDRFLEVIVAPSFSPEAKSILAQRWKNARLVAVGPLSAGAPGMRWRSVAGGMLVQDADSGCERADAYVHAAGPAPGAGMRLEAAFAMTVAKHLKSNAVCITSGRRLRGAGAGQMDRVAACRLAVEKAAAPRAGAIAARTASGPGAASAGSTHAGSPGSEIEALVAASDAFFPFPDGPRLLIDAGVRCIVHPGGSKRDAETFDLCNERGVTCLTTGVRHFRH